MNTRINNMLYPINALLASISPLVMLQLERTSLLDQVGQENVFGAHQ